MVISLFLNQPHPPSITSTLKNINKYIYLFYLAA